MGVFDYLTRKKSRIPNKTKYFVYLQLFCRMDTDTESEYHLSDDERDFRRLVQTENHHLDKNPDKLLQESQDQLNLLLEKKENLQQQLDNLLQDRHKKKNKVCDILVVKRTKRKRYASRVEGLKASALKVIRKYFRAAKESGPQEITDFIKELQKLKQKNL